MRANWADLERLLFRCSRKDYEHPELGLIYDWTEGEITYLKGAYKGIEDLWEETTATIWPKVILIGEAPLYGQNRSYIYAEHVPPSAFLYFEDVPGVRKGIKGSLERKKDMLRVMSAKGVVITDLLPFALNAEDTPHCNFNKGMTGKRYSRLIEEVFPLFAAPRIESLLVRNPNAKIVFRYKRTLEAVGNLFEGLSAELHHVSGTNMSMDRAKFHELING